MRVGLTMRVVSASNYMEPRDAISHDFIRWLESLGWQVALIPNCLRSSTNYLEETGIEAIVLSSGNDVIPRPGTLDDTSAERDLTENAMIVSAISLKRPVFGICRGLHIINRYFGGCVKADISTIDGASSHVATTHDVRLSERFAQIGGHAQIKTNSFHNQGFTRDDLGSDLVSFAESVADGVIEGLHHAELPILAVQWHPERKNFSAEFDRVLIQRLFSEGAFWR